MLSPGSAGAAWPPCQQQGAQIAETEGISNSFHSIPITSSAAPWMCETWVDKQQGNHKKASSWHLILQVALATCLMHSRSTLDNTDWIIAHSAELSFLFPRWRSRDKSCPVRSHRVGAAGEVGLGRYMTETFQKTADSTLEHGGSKELQGEVQG